MPAFLFLALLLYPGLPVTALFLLFYGVVLLLFFICFRSEAVTALFAAGTFLFHIMNFHMFFFGLAARSFHIRSIEEFRETFLYPALIFLVFSTALTFLLVFRRLITDMSVRLLLENRGQLVFATISLSFIDVYLFVLSAAYDSRPYTGMLMAFLSVTAALLFGAFYTAFLHAVRMSLLQSYAYVDPLTGVNNRRQGLSRLEELSEEGRPFSICLVDLDHLKQVNDTCGHQEGDRYLLAVSGALSAVFSARNVCRLGGDEFLVAAPEKDAAQVSELMGAAREQAEDIWNRKGEGVSLSFSFGAVTVEKPEKQNLPLLISEADRKMYEMKEKQYLKRL